MAVFLGEAPWKVLWNYLKRQETENENLHLQLNYVFCYSLKE